MRFVRTFGKRQSSARHLLNTRGARHRKSLPWHVVIAKLFVPVFAASIFIVLNSFSAQAVTTVLVPEAFTGPNNGVTEAQNNGWSVGGTGTFWACGSVVNPSGSFASINHTDMVSASGTGPVDRLRLVYNHELCETGYAQYDVAQTAVAGLDINFNLSMNGAGGGVCPASPTDNYNAISGAVDGQGNPDNTSTDCQADGFVFYLKDGANSSSGGESLGQAGGSLGYSAQATANGLDGGLLGIGFDAYGNFYQQPFGGADCTVDPSYNDQATYAPLGRRSLVIRGAEGRDQYGNPVRNAGYCRIATDSDRIVADQVPGGPNRNIGVALPTPLFSLSGQAVRILIDPEDLTMGDNGSISIYVSAPNTTNWSGVQPVARLEIPQELRDVETFKFGFVAGTGGGTMNADIWATSVHSIRPVPAVEWKTPPTNYCGVGSSYFYAQLAGRLGVQPYHYQLNGTLPSGLALNAGTGVIEGTITDPVGSTSNFSVTLTDSSQPSSIPITQNFSVAVSGQCSQLLAISDHSLQNNYGAGGKLDTISHDTFSVQGYSPEWTQRWYRCDAAPAVNTSAVIQPLDSSCAFSGATGVHYRPGAADVGKYLAFAVSASDVDMGSFDFALAAPGAHYTVDITDNTTSVTNSINIVTDQNSVGHVTLTRAQRVSGHSFSLIFYANDSVSRLSAVVDSTLASGNADDTFAIPLDNTNYVLTIHDVDTNQSWVADYNFWIPNNYTAVSIVREVIPAIPYIFSNAPNLDASHHFQYEMEVSDYHPNSTITGSANHASTVRYTSFQITAAMLAPSILNLDSLSKTGSNPGTWTHSSYDATGEPDTIVESWLLCDSALTVGGFQSAAVQNPATALIPNTCSAISGANGQSYAATNSQAGKYLVFAVTATNQFGSWTEFRSSALLVSSVTQTPTPTVTPTVTASPTSTSSASATPTATASPTASVSASSSANAQSTPAPSSSANASPSATATATPSASASASASPTASPRPSASASAVVIAPAPSASNPPTNPRGSSNGSPVTPNVPTASPAPTASVDATADPSTVSVAAPQSRDLALDPLSVVASVIAPKADAAIGATGNDNLVPREFSPLATPESAKRFTALAAWFVILIASTLVSALGRERKSLRLGSLVEADAEIEYRRQRRLGWGDRLPLFRLKAITWLDKFSADAIRVTYAKSPVLAKIFNEGAYLRAFFGSLTIFAALGSAALGVFAALTRDTMFVMPSTWLLLAIVAIGLFDAFNGFVATFALVSTTLLTMQAGSIQDYRTLLGLFVLGFTPALSAEAFRSVRRRVEKNGAYVWERISDFAIAPLIGGITTVAMVSVLPALANLTLPIANHVIEFGIVAAVGLFLRVALEEFASRAYPARMDVLNPDDLKQPTRLRKFIGIVFKAALYIFVSTAIFGLSWQVWVACLIFVIPALMHLFEDRLPNSRALWRFLPKGIPGMALSLVIAFFSVTMVTWVVRNPAAMARYGFMLVAIPALILTVLHVLGRHGSEGEMKPILHPDRKWLYRLGGIVMYSATVWLVANA